MATPHQLDRLTVPRAPRGGASAAGDGARTAPAPFTLPPLEVVQRGRAPLGASAPGEAAPEAAEPAPPPPPWFDEAELAKAMAHAWAAGAEAAAAAVRAELTAAAEHRTSLAAEAIAAELARSQAGLAASCAARAVASRDLTLALARALVPRALAERPLADIEAMLVELVGRLDGQPRLDLFVAPDLVASAEALLGRIATEVGHEGALTLHPDPALGPGDARLTWTDGAAVRDLAALEREAVALVDAWLSPAAATAPALTAIEPKPAPPPPTAGTPTTDATLEPVP